MKKNLPFRYFTLFLVLIMISLALPSFAQGDGAYSAKADGNNGPVEVEVVIKNNLIDSVNILSHSETPIISDAAFDRIPQAIVAGQTLSVDVVTGATNTSNAILTAAKDALEEAGMDIDALMVSSDKAASEGETITLEADVAIVGGGGAGMIAAIQASQLGGSVIIAEKTAALGGNTIVSGGNYAAVDPERQNRQNIEDSVEKHIEQVFTEGDSAAKKELVTVMCENALAGIHWLEDLGVEWEDDVWQVIGSLWPRTHSNIERSGSYLVGKLKAALETNDVQVLYETKATQLIEKDGRVVGFIATGADGNTYEVYGKNGIILTTGGFGANLEMCMKYSPKITENTKSLSVASAQGEGLVMAEAVGAKLIDLDYIQMLPISLTTLPGSNNSVLYINQEGERFVREDGRRDKMSIAVLNQTGGYCYVLNDQAVVDQEGTQEKADALVASGDVFKADTIEELAKIMEIPVDNLNATIENYNELVAGTEEDEFGRELAELPFGKAPFYCSKKQYPMVLYTCGGVDIDTSARVLDTQGNPIPGLYAAGEVTGGVHGQNRLGSHALADVTVFGRIAAETAMTDTE